MAAYRKKITLSIDAVQAQTAKDGQPVPPWLRTAIEQQLVQFTAKGVVVHSTNGKASGSLSSWIIRTPEHDLSLCRDDRFWDLYELTPADPQQHLS